MTPRLEVFRMHPDTFCYRLYGLEVETWLPLPELIPTGTSSLIDVRFIRGSVPSELSHCRYKGARYQAAPMQWLGYLDDVAHFFVDRGNEVHIQPEPHASEAELQAALLASPLAALLMQRGLIVLHASCVATPAGAVVFMGNSGSGKSTLAAWGIKRGWNLISDDLTVIKLDADGAPHVIPGCPQIRLWPDAAAKILQYRPSSTVTHPLKVSIPCTQHFHSTAAAIHRIYQIDSDNSLTLNLHRSSEAARTGLLFRQTYRRQFVDGMDLSAAYSTMITQLSRAAEIVRIRRGKHDAPVDDVGDLVATDLGK